MRSYCYFFHIDIFCKKIMVLATLSTVGCHSAQASILGKVMAIFPKSKKAATAILFLQK